MSLHSCICGCSKFYKVNWCYFECVSCGRIQNGKWGEEFHESYPKIIPVKNIKSPKEKV